MCAALPAYAKRLDLLHESLRPEFRQIVARIPNLAGARVIDVGCGDGFFTELIALGGAEVVWAVDSDPAFLLAASERLRALVTLGRVRLVENDARQLAFKTGSVDVAWSAHSMQSYERIPDILAEFHRVLRPGGVLAILESDAIHSVILPWPPRLELAVREAERVLLADADDRIGAYFPRYAPRLIAEAGFTNFTVHPTFIYRPSPLDAGLKDYVSRYLSDLVGRVSPRLEASLAAMAESFAASYTAADGGASMASLQVFMTATRGSDAHD